MIIWNYYRRKEIRYCKQFTVHVIINLSKHCITETIFYDKFLCQEALAEVTFGMFYFTLTE